ncbi:MAG: penicillin-binding transpeptidase domain-containing protein [Candidatus Cloacimonetes bacterium]|nr:penicillin-binding transpeptidase domain-containing protein [Candidatus Cloacimonadota bacterium]
MDKRFKSLLIFYTTVILVWIIYLYNIQINDPFSFRETRYGRYEPSKEILIPVRGSILDRNGEILVNSMNSYQIDIDRASIKIIAEDDESKIKKLINDIAEVVSQNSEMNRSDILKKLNSKTNSRSVCLGTDFSEEDILKIETALSEKKLNVFITNFSSMKRVHTRNNLAGRLIGICSDNSRESATNQSIYSLRGICGIEATHNDYLKGEYGWKERYFSGDGKVIPMPGTREKSVKNGNSVKLTIDADFQEVVEKNLKLGLEKYKAQNAIAVFMNPSNGEIIAMSGVSAKNENLSEMEIRALPNLPATFNFEPGSTMKVFTSLLAIEDNLYKWNEKIDCKEYKIGRRRIKDAHEYKFLSHRDIIAYSSNVGISKIVEKVGANKLYNRLIEFGFGNKTGSGLAGESNGFLAKVNAWQGYSLHSISFGQELSVTALQLANAYCTLANGGNVMRPIIVKEILDNEGNIIEIFEPRILRKVSDTKSLDSLKSYMRSVVDYGTASGLKVNGISFAGKTGTAEKVEKGKNVYSKEKYIASFAGYFPADNPEIVGIVIFDEPLYQYRYGSQSAVPVFEDITREILTISNYANIRRKDREQKEYISAPDVVGLSLKEAEEILKAKNIDYLPIINDKNGFVINQFPKANIAYSSDKKLSIVIDKKERVEEAFKNDSVMPDLVGYTSRKALQIAKQKKIKLVIEGVGRIIQQSIPAGNKINFGELCVVKAEN